MATKIESFDETINPWGFGCFGPGGTAQAPQLCFYCYAVRLAHRNLVKCQQCRDFIPHWHAHELDRIVHWQKPRIVFVESMGDPFGPWVEDAQRGQVINKLAAWPQHTYIWLTKQPSRMWSCLRAVAPSLVKNHWFGSSLTSQTRADMSLEPMSRLHREGFHTFASCEPLLSGFGGGMLAWADWVLIGAQTGPGAAHNRPQRMDVERLIVACDQFKIPVFLKNSISKLWPDLQRQEWPEGMRGGTS